MSTGTARAIPYRPIQNGKPTGFRCNAAMRPAGAAVVELAICLPFLTFIVFGSIEVANSVYLKQTITAAAFEVAQVVTGDGGTEAAARLRGEEMLAACSVKDYTITISPAAGPNTPPGRPVTVTIEAAADANAIGLYRLMSGARIVRTVSMNKM